MDEICKLRVKPVWHSKCEIVRRSSARSKRACGARGKFGCWWTFLSSAAPACKAVGAIREGLVSRGQDQPVPSCIKGWHGVSGQSVQKTGMIIINER